MMRFRRAGDYAVVGGEEWFLERSAGRWVVVRPAVGAVPSGWTRRNEYTDERVVDDSEKQHGIIRLSYDGTYRGVPVTMTPSFSGRMTVYSVDFDAARKAGMRVLERDTMVADVEADDPELDVRVHRTRLPFPE
ncbi:hypothetical protein LG315_10125 [Microbacterium marinum]|uniref:hypothetical protein n=1 Tax=Microbacterium marinum TaxID=421115 RepID=UPI00384B7E3F